MKKIIDIPNPCYEKWEEMNPTDKGRFCLTCQKNVQDFSNKSDNEILKILSKNKENVCGRFRKEQLNHPLKSRISTKPWPKWSVLAGFFTLIQPKNTQAEAKLNPDLVAIYQKNKTTEPRNNSNKITTIIKGVILDSSDLSFLPGISIYIEGTKVETVSDEKGDFELNLDILKQDLQEIQIKFQGVGFITQVIKLTTNDLKQNELFLKIRMKADVSNYQELVVIAGAICIKETPTILDKIKQTFKNFLFRALIKR